MTDPRAGTPPTPAQRRASLASALNSIAREERSSVAHYGNLTTAEGMTLSRRLLSKTGFPEGTEVTYVTPSSTAVEVGMTPRETINRVVFHPIGWEMDLQRLTSQEQVDKALNELPTANGAGRRPYPPNRDYHMPGYADLEGVTRNKIIKAVRDMTGPRALKSWHFLVTRAGDLIVGAALDDRTTLSSVEPANTIDIAYESMLIIWHDPDALHIDQNVKFIDAPCTPAQSRTLAVLLAKLENACPSWSWQTAGETGPGLTSAHLYDRARMITNGYTSWCFTSNLWTSVEGIPFDYSDSDFAGLILQRTEIPQFDLATEVFRPPQDVAQQDLREIARAALSSEDTLGASCAMMGNYAYVAARQRGAAMLDAPRTAYIMRRANIAAAHAEGSAAEASRTESMEDPPESTTTNSDGALAAALPAENSPFIYDFTTGLWGDRNPV